MLRYLLFLLPLAIWSQNETASLSYVGHKNHTQSTAIVEIDGIVIDLAKEKLITVQDSTTPLDQEDLQLSRWLAADQHESKYPSHSPYNFVANTPMIAIDPDGKEIVFIGNKADIFQMKMALAFMRVFSPTFRDMYRKLKNSSNTHRIHLVTPFEPEKMTREEKYDLNARKYSFGKYKDANKAPDRLLEEELLSDGNRSAGGGCVLSESNIKREYLKNNHIDPNIDCATNNDENGYGEGSHMVFCVRARIKEGILYKLYHGRLRGGLSTLAHEFSHMFHIDRGHAHNHLPSAQEKEYFAEEGIDIKNNNGQPEVCEELEAVDIQNKVAAEIKKNTGMKNQKRTRY